MMAFRTLPTLLMADRMSQGSMLPSDQQNDRDSVVSTYFCLYQSAQIAIIKALLLHAVPTCHATSSPTLVPILIASTFGIPCCPF